MVFSTTFQVRQLFLNQPWIGAMGIGLPRGKMWRSVSRIPLNKLKLFHRIFLGIPSFLIHIQIQHVHISSLCLKDFSEKKRTFYPFFEVQYTQQAQHVSFQGSIIGVNVIIFHKPTLPETNIFAPENGWLEDVCFLLGWCNLAGATYVVVSENVICCYLLWAKLSSMRRQRFLRGELLQGRGRGHRKNNHEAGGAFGGTQTRYKLWFLYKQKWWVFLGSVAYLEG